MKYEINKFYGILTNGDNSVRKTTSNRAILNALSSKIVDALIPQGLADTDKEALAEFYIRLIYTDKSLISALESYDPLNSYTLHTFYADDNKLNVSPTSIIVGIKKLGLAGEELSFMPVDYIINALKQLLAILNA